jgi:hypothetical protein
MSIKGREVLNYAVQIMIAGRLPDSYSEINLKIFVIKEKFKKMLRSNQSTRHQIQVRV